MYYALRYKVLSSLLWASSKHAHYFCTPTYFLKNFGLLWRGGHNWGQVDCIILEKFVKGGGPMCKHLWITIGKVRLCKKCKLQLLSDGSMFIEVTKKGAKIRKCGTY